MLLFATAFQDYRNKQQIELLINYRTFGIIDFAGYQNPEHSFIYFRGIIP